ncbi:hypothetical protein Tco_0722135 [Tanacetum coccineum]
MWLVFCSWKTVTCSSKAVENYPPKTCWTELRKMFEKPPAIVEIYDTVGMLYICCRQAPGTTLLYIEELRANKKKFQGFKEERKDLWGSISCKWANETQAAVESHRNVWGCEAYVKRDSADKLQHRSVKCIFIGYPKETMGYYFYFPPENTVIVARSKGLIVAYQPSVSKTWRLKDDVGMDEENDSMKLMKYCGMKVDILYAKYRSSCNAVQVAQGRLLEFCSKLGQSISTVIYGKLPGCCLNNSKVSEGIRKNCFSVRPQQRWNADGEGLGKRGREKEGNRGRKEGRKSRYMQFEVTGFCDAHGNAIKMIR